MKAPAPDRAVTVRERDPITDRMTSASWDASLPTSKCRIPLPHEGVSEVRFRLRTEPCWSIEQR